MSGAFGSGSGGGAAAAPAIGWSIVDVSKGALGPSSKLGNQTSGTYFAVQSIVTFSAARTYWAGGATTLKGALWRFAGGVLLASGTLAVPGPGTYSIPFAVPYVLTAAELGAEHAISVYDQAGAGGSYSSTPIGAPDPNTTPARPFMAGPVFTWAAWNVWAAGDAFPANLAGSENYIVEPVFA